MQVNLFGTMYSMGGVTGVATYPEYMKHGLMSHLMKKALAQHAARTTSACRCSIPYLIPYYRKKGWEIVSDKMTYTIKDTQLPKHHKVGGMVERVDIDSEDVHRVHDAFYRHAPRRAQAQRAGVGGILAVGGGRRARRRVLRREREADRLPRLLHRQRRVPHQGAGVHQSGGAPRPLELYLRALSR